MAEDYLSLIASEYDVDPVGFKRMAQIESGGNPRLVNRYGYSGLFQLSPGEFRKWGGGSILDPVANARAAAKKLSYESNMFKEKYGRDPTLTDLYMQHQQGVGGAAAHLARPDSPAWANMASTGEGRQKGAGWAKKAIWGNIPDSPRYSPYFNKTMFPGGVDDVTSKAFMNGWKAKLENAPIDLGAPFGGPPANQSLDDQFAGTVAPPQSETGEPGAEDKFSAAMTGGKGSEVEMASPTLNITQQRSAIPAQDLADLYNDALGYQKLADALLSSGRAMGQTARSPWQALGSIAQMASGSYQAEQAKEADRDYVSRLSAALGGSASPDTIRGAMLANPETRMAAMQSVLKSRNPEYGKNVIWMQNDKGEIVPMQASDAGGITEAKLPPGYKFIEPPKTIDTPTEVRTYGAKTGIPGEVIKKDIAGATEQKEGAEILVKARDALPQVESQTSQVLHVLDRLEKHPMRKNFTGWAGYLPTVSPQANSYQAFLNQIHGQAFLGAFTSLRGGGQITDAEGRKATDALIRLQTIAPSDEGFQEALNDARAVFNEILANARARAAGGEGKSLPQATVSPIDSLPLSAPKQRIKYNPKTGDFE